MSEQELKEHGKSFHFASFFLSRVHFESAAKLYGICRRLDDLADKNDNPQKEQQLQEILSAIRTKNFSHQFANEAGQITPEIDLDVLAELIEGVAGDILDVRMRSETELLQYCYQVAGTVGLLMCDVFGVHNPEARHHAVDLGVAMQLTNISRDVKEDAENNRRYLPSSLVGELSPSEILSPTHEQAKQIKACVAWLLEQAEIRYESGFAGLPFLPPRARLAILVAGLLYREIGMIVAGRSYNIWLPRAHTSVMTKVLTTMRGIITYIFSRKVHRYQTCHDANLHRGLAPRPGVDCAT